MNWGDGDISRNFTVNLADPYSVQLERKDFEFLDDSLGRVNFGLRQMFRIDFGTFGFSDTPTTINADLAWIKTFCLAPSKSIEVYNVYQAQIVNDFDEINVGYIDGFVFALILLAYNFKPKDLMIWGVVFLSYYFARFLYFGDVFSNTYYLKLGYPFLERLEKVWKWEYLVFLLSPRKYILPILGVFAYHLYTGGDAWEQYNVFNRFLTITVPVLFESESFKDTLIGSYK